MIDFIAPAKDAMHWKNAATTTAAVHRAVFYFHAWGLQTRVSISDLVLPKANGMGPKGMGPKTHALHDIRQRLAAGPKSTAIRSMPCGGFNLCGLA